jgi:hypothetical protein
MADSNTSGEEPADPIDEVQPDELRLVPEESPDLSAWDRAIQERLEQDRRRASFRLVDVMDEEEPVRFSVRDVLVLTAFAAVLFAMFRLVRPDAFALALGVVAFISLVALSMVRQRNSILHVGWWVLLVVYLVTAIVTVFT